jgi:hypothetical protein
MGSRDGASASATAASPSSRNTQRAPRLWGALFFDDRGACAGFALFTHTA